MDYTAMHCHPKPTSIRPDHNWPGSQADFEWWYHNQGKRGKERDPHPEGKHDLLAWEDQIHDPKQLLL